MIQERRFFLTVDLEKLPKDLQARFIDLRCRKLFPVRKIARELEVSHDVVLKLLKTAWYKEAEAEYVKRIKDQTYKAALVVEKYRSKGIAKAREASEIMSEKALALAKLIPSNDFVGMKETVILLEKVASLVFKLGFIDQEHRIQAATAAATKVGVQAIQIGGDPMKAKHILMEGGMNLDTIFEDKPRTLPGDTPPVTLDINLLEE